MSSTLSQLERVSEVIWWRVGSLQYFCDDSCPHGDVTLPQGEALVDLKGKVVTKGDGQGCVITRHNHVHSCERGKKSFKGQESN